MDDEAANYVLPQDIFEIQDDASARPVRVRDAATRARNRSATVIGCGSRCPQPSHSGTWCFALQVAWRPGAASVVRGWNLSGAAVTRHRMRASKRTRSWDEHHVHQTRQKNEPKTECDVPTLQPQRPDGDEPMDDPQHQPRRRATHKRPLTEAKRGQRLNRARQENPEECDVPIQEVYLVSGDDW